MKLAMLAVLLLLPHANAAATVTVTLDVEVLGHDYKSCDVAVPEGATAHAVLDAAVAQGCLLRWTSQEYPGYGAYVDCIDLVCGTPATYWAFFTNGEYAALGIDAYVVQDGDVLGFDHQQWAVPLP